MKKKIPCPLCTAGFNVNTDGLSVTQYQKAICDHCKTLDDNKIKGRWIKKTITNNNMTPKSYGTSWKDQQPNEARIKYIDNQLCDRLCPEDYLLMMELIELNRTQLLKSAL